MGGGAHGEEAVQSPVAGPGSTARLVFTRTAWEQYLSHTDRRLVRPVNDLIADIMRNGHEGIGKPEPLRGELSGFWSRRIDQEHRLVYRIRGSDIEVIACQYHYQA
jgi:toxin YoeB